MLVGMLAYMTWRGRRPMFRVELHTCNSCGVSQSRGMPGLVLVENILRWIVLIV